MGAPSGSRKSLLLLTYFLSCAVVANEAARAKLPNILFVLMDDLGWNDVGFRNNEFHTPTIDDLYSKGIRINNSYTTPNCGPSRAALLSGVYPHKMGLQGNAINSRSSAAVPSEMVLLPQELKKLGYQTHLVGKWHQGFCRRDQTPTNRGFDSFFGFYLAKQDHFTHRFRGRYYDFRSNHHVDRSVQGQYSTHVYTDRTRQLISEYKEQLSESRDTKPFFILLSYAAIHSPNQVPQHYIDKYCSAIEDPERQKKCGMMAAVDEGLENIIDDLQDLNLMDDVLIVFTSDDGGSVNQGSSNWPLRGTKRTLWEGGIRVNTFLYSSSSDILPKQNFTYEGLFYITDFYATLVGLVQNNTVDRKFDAVNDSYNEWSYLQQAQEQKSHRKSFAYFDYEHLGVAMVRKEDWKLLHRQDRKPGWYYPPLGEEAPSASPLDEYQLFDLRSDPSETTDLRNEHPDRFSDLIQDLWKERRKVQKPIDKSLPSAPRSRRVWTYGWCDEE